MVLRHNIAVLLTAIILYLQTTAFAQTVPPPKIAVSCLEDARASVSWSGSEWRYCLHRNTEKRLHIALISDQNFILRSDPVNIDMALSLLVSSSAKPLHQALLNAAGPDLEILRLEQLKELQNSNYASGFNENSLISLNPGGLGKLIDKATILARLGFVDQALNAYQKPLLAFEKSAEKLNGKPLPDEKQWQWLSLRMAHNTQLIYAGREVEGFAGYKKIIGDNRLSASNRINAKVNLAAFLAEYGQFSEALKWINEASREFDGQINTVDRYKLSGSNRHFAWIKACALNGLGKSEEAKAYIAVVTQAVERPIDPHASVYSTSRIENRLFACIGDADAMANELINRNAHPLLEPSGALFAQPGKKTHNERYNKFREKLLKHPIIQQIAKKSVALPPSALPALNQWS